jgi:deoxyribodipyrimidine photo-lyase
MREPWELARPDGAASGSFSAFRRRHRAVGPLPPPARAPDRLNTAVARGWPGTGRERFLWRDDDTDFRAWGRGRTGYPIVDAAMRQLWRTGFMPNRVRMVAASFLIKRLLIDWRRGEQWFWDTLTDAVPASNPTGWQRIAGSGADAAPNFRIFNPALQAEKFDPGGPYVRRWIPELAQLAGPDVHTPWRASTGTLARAGVALGKTYPQTIVDHPFARARALAPFAALRAL